MMARNLWNLGLNGVKFDKDYFMTLRVLFLKNRITKLELETLISVSGLGKNEIGNRSNLTRVNLYKILEKDDGFLLSARATQTYQNVIKRNLIESTKAIAAAISASDENDIEKMLNGCSILEAETIQIALEKLNQGITNAK